MLVDIRHFGWQTAEFEIVCVRERDRAIVLVAVF
jgi:hypothetical protein